MKYNSITAQVISAIIIFIILITYLSPSTLFMPRSLSSMLTLFLVLSFLAFSALIWNEKPRDERENLHRLHAGRISFLVGTTILTTGITFQSFSHNVDPWLIAVLIGMIISKLASRSYSKITQ